MKTAAIITMLAIISLSGCNGGTPKCSNDDVQATVIELINQQIEAYGLPEATVSLTAIRTTGEDKALGRCDCETEAYINDNPVSITYSASRTDTGEIYIEVYGL